MQSTVARRFNRRRYDAARTAEAFSVRLREQVDLDRLSADLLAVVEQTMEPTTVWLWLWLRPPSRVPGTWPGGRNRQRAVDRLAGAMPSGAEPSRDR